MNNNTNTSPEMCGVCLGTGKPLSGKPCICDGKGTLDAEMHGLRELVFELEDQIQRLKEENSYLHIELDSYRGQSG